MKFNFKNQQSSFHKVYFTIHGFINQFYKELCIGLLPVYCVLQTCLRLLTKTSTQEKSEFREWFVGCVLSKTNISSFLQQSTCKNKSKPTVINPCIYQRLGLFSFFFFFLQNNFRFVRSNFDNVYLQDPNAVLPAMGFDQSLFYVYCDVSIL